MKRCPECRRDYYDDTLLYCLDDGNALLEGPASAEEPKTVILSESEAIAPNPHPSESPTQIFQQDAVGPIISDQRSNHVASRRKSIIVGGIGILLFLVFAIGGYWFYRTKSNDPAAQIESIAVMPFVNESGNPDNEYLSDGMTETLITTLSQLSGLNVKARGSVFRYKGKEIEPRRVGAELSVQAILSGRVVQRGNDLTLYIELVDTSNENTLWKADYNRPITNLVALQNEIARDVSSKLRVRLSGVDEQKLAKNYTANTEAYQLYLRGRYHLLKTTRSEFQTSITYFQQAIAIDPSYALAYTGLADAYRSLSVAGEMPSAEVMPQSKVAAQKAIEIDDTLAEAHAILGFTIFWYDWDWNAAENQYKRALELNPNNADAHIFYGHLLSNIGRSAEALAEGKRAREIDPLNLRTNALDGQFFIHAGQVDEGLARLQRTSALEPNYWLPHNFIASAYIEKGMYPEAIAAARKGRELSGVSTQPLSFLGYALAKSGRQTEARAELDKLLKLSSESYVAPYTIAMIYNGLGERDNALAWLERGVDMRDPRMVFLKVEPKWNNLRGDTRFQEVLRKVGFPQ